MEHWLEHVSKPKRLWVAWQSPSMSDRFRWAIGVLEGGTGEVVFRYLRGGPEFEAANDGRTYERLIERGFAGYPAFNLKQHEHRHRVLEVFKRRIPPRDREDYAEYLKHFRMPTNLEVSDFSLFSITEAKLPSDGFSIVDPHDGNCPCQDLLLEIAGFRYYCDHVRDRLRPGDVVTVELEPANPYDPSAVMLTAHGVKIGNVNRLQTKAFGQWLRNQSVEAWIERLNGREDHPRAFVFVRVRPRLAKVA